jgi:hypothetical protein
MEALIYFLLIAALFAIMMKFGCSARSKISSSRGNADLPKAEPFRPLFSNREVLVRSNLSKGQR